MGVEKLNALQTVEQVVQTPLGLRTWLIVKEPNKSGL